MVDISVIILVGKEELHIKRCLEKLAGLAPRQIFVIESQPGDNTHEIAIRTAQALGWRVRQEGLSKPQLEPSSLDVLDFYTFFHTYPGRQSIQFNWALTNMPITSSWVLRLDADEYITSEGIQWLKNNLSSVSSSISALEFVLERKFMGGFIRHATNGIRMVRLFRFGRGQYADTLMDERIVYEGEKLSAPVVFYDDNLNSLAWWKEKHRGYAKREAEQALAGTFQDPRKAGYYRLPPYFRAVFYFCVRYFLKGGILDGIAGWRWNFWQGLWYRWLVDNEIKSLKKKH